VRSSTDPTPAAREDSAVTPVQRSAPAGRIARRAPWLRLAAAAAAGGLLVLAFPPFGWWPLAILCVAVLALLTRGRSGWAGAALGGAFGLAFFVPLLSWTGIYVGPAPWLILAAAQAGYLALVGAGLALVGRLPGWPLWGAALWVAEEALRSRWPFGGFPWGRLGFALAESPLAALAGYGGAPLVTFCAALAGGLLAGLALARSSPRMSLAPAVALLAVIGLTAAAGARLPGGSSRGVVVAVVQGNVPRLGLDFNAQREAVLRNHVLRTLDLAAQIRSGRVPRPDLVIWPENASDVDPLVNEDARAQIDEAAQAVGVPILVGAILDGPKPDQVRNVGIVWDPATGPGARYVKRHPVPWGEYIPMRRIARLVSKDVDRVRRDMVGGDQPGVLRVGPITLGDVICFEVAYDGLVRDAVRGGGELLVVQTNNATFGRSHETWQQLAMGRLRAIEHGRSVLIAATSGVSAMIGPDGHLLARSDVFTADVLVRTVPVRAETTLATHLGAVPEYLLVVIALAAVAVAVVRSRRRTRPGVVTAGVSEPSTAAHETVTSEQATSETRASETGTSEQGTEQGTGQGTSEQGTGQGTGQGASETRASASTSTAKEQA
jgi:apolipoprotein N-acyltransferase